MAKVRSEFRMSQGVVPFGVGAIIDFQDESLMAAGLDAWPTERATGEHRVILTKACRVDDGFSRRRGGVGTSALRRSRQ